MRVVCGFYITFGQWCILATGLVFEKHTEGGKGHLQSEQSFTFQTFQNSLVLSHFIKTESAK